MAWRGVQSRWLAAAVYLASCALVGCTVWATFKEDVLHDDAAAGAADVLKVRQRRAAAWRACAGLHPRHMSACICLVRGVPEWAMNWDSFSYGSTRTHWLEEVDVHEARASSSA